MKTYEVDLAIFFKKTIRHKKHPRHDSFYMSREYIKIWLKDFDIRQTKYDRHIHYTLEHASEEEVIKATISLCKAVMRRYQHCYPEAFFFKQLDCRGCFVENEQECYAVNPFRRPLGVADVVDTIKQRDVICMRQFGVNRCVNDRMNHIAAFRKVVAMVEHQLQFNFDTY